MSVEGPTASADDPVGRVVIVEAAPEHDAVLTELFARTGVPCHCRYWHFEGDKNAWLARCALDPDKNRQEMRTALAERSGEMNGVIAIDATGQAVGWLKATSAIHLRKLYSQRLYRGLPCFDGSRDGIVAVGCLLVDERWRGRGVARRLVTGCIEAARRARVHAIEAFPRRAERVSDAEMWTGPARIFLEAGFTVVHDFGPYPVLRLEL